MRLFGYARVSTSQQSLELQIVHLGIPWLMAALDPGGEVEKRD
jgi:hypothetical protein